MLSVFTGRVDMIYLLIIHTILGVIGFFVGFGVQMSTIMGVANTQDPGALGHLFRPIYFYSAVGSQFSARFAGLCR